MITNVAKPYNSYNLFFILERALLIQARTGQSSTSDGAHDDLSGYEGLEQDVPSLPPRYQHLKLSPTWFIPGKKKNVPRKHTKTHGVASFREIPKIVADNWRAIDPVTKMFVEAVASILKERYAKLPDCVKTLRKTSKKNKRSRSPVDSSSKESSLMKSPPDNSLPVMSNSEQVISLPVAVSPTSFLDASAKQNLFTGYNFDSVHSTRRFCQQVGTLDSCSCSFDFSRQMPYQDKAARRFSEVPISDREIIGFWVAAD